MKNINLYKISISSIVALVLIFGIVLFVGVQVYAHGTGSNLNLENSEISKDDFAKMHEEMFGIMEKYGVARGNVISATDIMNCGHYDSLIEDEEYDKMGSNNSFWNRLFRDNRFMGGMMMH